MPQRFIKMKQEGEKIAALTAYDATTARLLEAASIDCILVGDSLGMVVKGEKDTLNVQLEETLYHVRAVVAGAPQTFVIGDMPFATFQQSPQQAFANAAKILAAGAAMVKIEGGSNLAETVHFLTQRGIPVCAHVGLMPQTVRASGGYRVQGRGSQAEQVENDAQQMQDAGAAMVVLEMLPQTLSASISEKLQIPTIGIGGGNACDGQILVVYDMLGMSAQQLRFVRNFLADGGSVADAIRAYITAVKDGSFPAQQHSID
ncbi:MAG: 3-methyl-2-oxobutanoate hydroxymethyltransferase [Proteobacteria bacterium]|nr:3-methyl-2-oxobutanoate hydroxymethyltransferase [Pseudomonadota bacterium]